MKKIFIAIASMAILLSCEDLTELNDNPKRTDIAPAGSLLASAEKSLIDNLSSTNVNQNIFRLVAQYWTETTYTDEANYDLGTRNIPQNWWHALYRDVLQDLRDAKRIAGESSVEAGVKQNQLAIAEILEVYTWSVLVNTFGDIPYTNALKVTASPDDILQPEYNDAAEIYTDLISRLTSAVASLDPALESWGQNDLFYAGDVAKWVKLGNSMMLKLGMTLADVNEGLARSTVEAAAPNVFASNEDNAVFTYLAAPPNTNPVWVDLVQSGRKDFVAANTIVDTLVYMEDPRIPAFFTIDADGGYTGGTYGASNNYATFSKPGDEIDNPDFPGTLMDYSEVEFFLAEAAERGFNVPGTAEEHYTQAIRASMESWGITDETAIETYLSRPDVDYQSAPGDFRQKIGFQKWIALYNRGYDAWTEWRRLDAPELVAPPDAFSDVPLRFTYPVSEQNLNTNNYDEVVQKIGEDDVSVPLFWDTM
jgi:hypothetical protein